MVLTFYHLQHERSKALIRAVLDVMVQCPVGNLRRSLLSIALVEERKPIIQARSLFLVSCAPVVRRNASGIGLLALLIVRQIYSRYPVLLFWCVVGSLSLVLCAVMMCGYPMLLVPCGWCGYASDPVPFYFPISVEARVLSPWYGLLPSRSCINIFFSIFLGFSRIRLDESRYVLVRTLTEERGPYISELFRGRHVIDRDPSFFN
ncbi:unnamed protein product [Laminaria digitata]